MGDIVLAGTSYGKVKAMFNERNQRMQEAGPSTPALILGLNGAPAAGDTFHVIETEQEAREIANKREQLQREQGLRTQKMLTLDEVGRRLALGDFHELNVIVKGDVDGSVEALSDSLIKLSTEQVQVNVIHKGVGQISESDVSLAAASDAIIVGFQVRPSGAAAKMAEQEGVDIRKYSVIYDAIEGGEGCHGRYAGTDIEGADNGNHRGARSVQHHEGGTGGRCHGQDRKGETQRQGPFDTRRYRNLYGCHQCPEALQGRREGGRYQLRVRYQPDKLQRHQGGRYYRSYEEIEVKQTL